MTDDQYVAEFNEKNPSAPVDAPAPAATQAPTPQQAPVTPDKAVEMFELNGQRFPTSLEFKIPHGGSVKNVPYSTLMNTYRQATHLEDKYKSFNTEKSEFQKQIEEYQALKAQKEKFGALQDWSEKSPEEFKVIWDMYQNRNQHLLASKAGLTPQAQMQNAQAGLTQGQNQGLAPEQLRPFVEEISSLKKQLGEFSQFKSQFDQEQQTKKEQADVNFVREEMKTFQTRYPEINLQEKDPDGVLLWAKIVKHGVDNQIPTFKAAALDFLEDRVLDTVSSRARNSTTQSIKTDKANGIIARSPTPFNKGQSTKIDPKSMSWSEAGQAAKAQYAELVARGQ